MKWLDTAFCDHQMTHTGICINFFVASMVASQWSYVISKNVKKTPTSAGGGGGEEWITVERNQSCLLEKTGN